MHIVAAIVAVGTNVTYFVWLSRIKAGGNSGVEILRGIKAIDSRLANPAYVVLPLTGVLMVLDADIGFGTMWVLTAIVLYVAVGALAGALFGPSLRRQTDLAASGAGGSDYAAAARRTTATGILTMLPIVGILYLMVMKPT